jgi:tRNA threonylcarbamoyladenosine biosynthesis protein TsaE
MFISRSAAETLDYASGIARQLRAGDVFALIGELGAGKTQFVKGMVAGLGSDDDVTSPTFNLLHEYRCGRLPVYHFDFYRLERAEEALRIGLDDYLYGEGVSLIEWADRFDELLPEHTTRIRFQHLANDERSIEGGPTP